MFSFFSKIPLVPNFFASGTEVSYLSDFPLGYSFLIASKSARKTTRRSCQLVEIYCIVYAGVFIMFD